MVAVLHQLRAQCEIAGPLHVLGASYGAAIAIFAARDLGADVGGVVAMESFDNAGGAVRDMVPGMLVRPVRGLGERLSRQWLRWHYDARALDTAQASTLAGQRPTSDR